jgi:hypothetical protein
MARKILIQFDCDPQPSTFDAVVAVDAGAEVLLRHGNVTPDAAVPLVHGAMFTRGGADLAATAIFVGGSDVAAAEAVYARVQQTFFGPVRVSVLLDPAGANTTAGAAVVAAGRHLPLADPAAAAGLRAVVLGGTGPVGQRVARLLARKGTAVTVASRSLSRAAQVCERIAAAVPGGRLEPVEATGAIASGTPLATAVAAADLIVAAVGRPNAGAHRSQRRAARGHRRDRGHRQGPAGWRGARLWGVGCRWHEDEDPPCRNPAAVRVERRLSRRRGVAGHR